MARVILAPLTAVILLVVAAGYGFFGFLTHVPMHEGQLHRLGAAGVDAHRRLAECYRDGCSNLFRSPVLSCAWRLVVIEETGGALADLAEVRANCDGLTDADRLKAEQAKQRLLHHISGVTRKA